MYVLYVGTSETKSKLICLGALRVARKVDKFSSKKQHFSNRTINFEFISNAKVRVFFRYCETFCITTIFRRYFNTFKLLLADVYKTKFKKFAFNSHSSARQTVIAILKLPAVRYRHRKAFVSTIRRLSYMAQIGDLAEETLLHIFRFIQTSDLQNNVKLVCKKWNRIVEDHVLYDRVYIDAKMKRSSALDILKKYSDHVKHVVLKERSDVNQLLMYVARCPNLQSLKLISCYGQVN